MQVVKRCGEVVPFEQDKIYKAILKAMKYGSGIIKNEIAKQIAVDSELVFAFDDVTPTVAQIEDFVYFSLLENDEELTAKSYEGYRAVQEHKRKTNTTDDSILNLISRVNEEVMNENSNKNAVLASTQRDLIAGEVSKDIARRKLIPSHIVQAHDEGILNYHDLDYAAQDIHNCMLINLEDMLDNGTVINKKMVKSPRSFSTACTVTTQIIAQIASGQYGGSSMTIKHLAKYLRKSYENRHYRMALRSMGEYLSALPKMDKEQYLQTVNHFKCIAIEEAKKNLMQELKDGIQTIRYQLSTLQTSNGQNPFATIYLEIEEGNEYEHEMALICEEMIKQRIEGMESETGNNIGEEFPKLVYLLDTHNSLEGGKYDYITELSAICSTKRLVPDYQSAKIMRMNYEGNTFPPMGCRSHLSPWRDINGDYKFYGRFNMGVISLNLVNIGLTVQNNKEDFWKLLDERLLLCKEALLVRYELLKGTTTDTSPIHWQHGGVSRLKAGQTIDTLLENGYATISLGYVGLYELTQAILGKSHTTPEGTDFALKVMYRLKQACDDWKKETGLGFGLYGTPAESTVYNFCRKDKSRFGEIKNITDKQYYTNSYHVFVGEKIDAFEKLKFESQFHSISSGGCISYVEVPNMTKNIEGMKSLINYIYHNVQYAEINSRPDVCYECNYSGEMELIQNKWVCPNCKNDDHNKMQVMRRTCGYISTNTWNKGKLEEISERVLHVD